MTVYFLSGLGADKSVFQFLNLAFCTPVFIDWINPQHNESMEHYAVRIKQECMPGKDAIIVGLSFGGMLATEIAKHYRQCKVILLSSSKTNKEIPAMYKVGKYFPAYQWLPNSTQKLFMRLFEKRFGLKSKEGKKIYQHVITNADISFNKWAVFALLHWNNMEVPNNVIHIHGTADKILPYKNVRCDYYIAQGGHLMVIENANEISALLNKLLV